MTRLDLVLLLGAACNPLLAAHAQQDTAEQGLAERLAQVMNCVLAVATVDTANGAARIAATHGTAFHIGSRGFALTAKHLLAGKPKPLAALTMSEAGGWSWVSIVASELHPSEDVAILKLESGACRSGFQLSAATELASSRYRIYGYPADATRFEGTLGEIPDLVYTEGYIRRRHSASVYPSAGPSSPAGAALISGTGFFELSQIAGPGTSGGPVFDFAEPLTVIAIYSAEKHTPYVITGNGSQITQLTSVSYAVRDDAFRNWKPAMLGGKTVLEESRTTR
jgi:hypothetical protein